MSDASAKSTPPVSARSTRAKVDISMIEDDYVDEPAENENEEDGADGNEQGDGEDEEELEDDEYIVEKILGHAVQDGKIQFRIKWEGYEKKSDQTWEDEDNIRENVGEMLDAYYDSIGGRETVFQSNKASASNKKRGRQSVGGATNGIKRNRPSMDEDFDEEAASASPPPVASASKSWKPPAGSWEQHIERIDACQDEDSGKLVVYLNWKDGHKSQHSTETVYKRCPQKMLQFYEQHIKIVKSAPDSE